MGGSFGTVLDTKNSTGFGLERFKVWPSESSTSTVEYTLT